MYFVNVSWLQTLQCSKLLKIWYVQNVIGTSKLIFLSIYQTTPGMGLSMDVLISNICTFMYGNTVCVTVLPLTLSNCQHCVSSFLFSIIVMCCVGSC